MSGNVEKSDLRPGIVWLTGCAPLVIAAERRFFARLPVKNLRVFLYAMARFNP